jgi:hypothetical protein
MASIPPPPDEPGAPAPGSSASGPSSKTTILAIVASVAVIAIIGTVLAVANGGDGAESGGSPSSSPSAVTAPTDVTAHASGFRVVLRWTPGAGGPVVRYVVSRDGVVKATVDPEQTGWVDRDVMPETRYTYEVAAVGPDGTSVGTTLDTRTATAGPATARLDGPFDVRLLATSHYGYSDFGSNAANLGWRFRPICAQGPCDARLADLHLKTFRVTLTRDGGSYRGDGTVNARVHCGRATVDSNVTITIRATDAGVVYGQWVATRIEGTMRQTEPPQLGCVGSGATYDLVGKVVVAGP